MNGLALAEEYYNTYGRKMLAEQFPEVYAHAAVGLIGMGSECFGFDDEVSKDHDYGLSFCIWLPREDYQKYGTKLQEAYNALPGEFMGFSRRQISDQGQGRVGVLCMEDFYQNLLGRCAAPETEAEWLALKDEELAVATNGRVFEDNAGEFTKIREGLLQYYPEKVWRLKIADCMAKAAQAGQYNYARAMKRGERVAAELSLSLFIREIMQLVYLLNKKYAPFYKWMHKGMQNLASCSEIGDMINLFYQIPDVSGAWENVPPDGYVNTINTNDGRVLIIEAICNIIVQELNALGLSEGEDNFLQNHVGNVLGNERMEYHNNA